MFIHLMVVPGLQFTLVRFASEVTKVTPPCPSHFIVYLSSFFNAAINVLLVPLEYVPASRHVPVVWGGGDGGIIVH